MQRGYVVEKVGRFVGEKAGKYTGVKLKSFGRNLFTKSDRSEVVHTPEIPTDVIPTLYIHIPFCHAPLCEMCPFFRVELEKKVAEKYVRDLRTELSRHKGVPFSSVYIGGGTPATVLPALVELVKEFGIGGKELSVEAHPSDLTEANVALMKEAGVTRLSVGVQSFDPELLELMKRNNGRNPVENLKRAAESFSVNADLIYNFAGQTVAQFENDIDILVGLGISQITCYPLMAAPGEFHVVDDSRESEFYAAMLKKFAQAGYKPLTPWCFAKATDESQGEYISSSNGDQYLGVGASAISKIGPYFTINSFNLSEYHSQVERGESAVIGIKKLNIFEDAQYFLLTGLFGMKLNLDKLTGNKAKDRLIRVEVKLLRAAKLVTVSDNTAVLTEAGMLFFSKAMKEFYTGLNFFRQKHKENAVMGVAG